MTDEPVIFFATILEIIGFASYMFGVFPHQLREAKVQDEISFYRKLILIFTLTTMVTGMAFLFASLYRYTLGTVSPSTVIYIFLINGLQNLLVVTVLFFIYRKRIPE